MSITPEHAKAHASAPAVTCCRFAAGTIVGPQHLEDPTILPELEKSGLLQIPGDCLTIGEVLGATLQESVDGFTPLMSHILQVSPDRPVCSGTSPQTHAHELHTEKCLRKHFRIAKVRRGKRTEIHGKTLYLRDDICQDARQTDAFVVDIELDIIDSSRYGEYSHTIMDVQPIATKEVGDLGSGITRVLDGVVIVITGTDEHGVQIGEFGSSEGAMDRTIMWGRPGAPDHGDILIKSQVTIKAHTNMERPGPLAAHKATEFITQEIRNALKHLDERLVVATDVLAHTRRPGQPKVVLIKEIMGQGAMHDNLLLPVEPVGIVGAKSNIDLGNVPVVVSPLQCLDGCVHALTCVGPASKETSRHYWREPLVLAVLEDDELDLCAVIFVGSPQSNADKLYVSHILGRTVEALGVDGAMVTTEGFGNNHIDFASHIEQIGTRGIAVVGMTYAAFQGQLVIGNASMDALVELNKSVSGRENGVLATNTLTHEDAVRAMAMLKAKMAGETITAADSTWNPQVKRDNLAKIAHTTGQKIALVATETSLPHRAGEMTATRFDLVTDQKSDDYI
jgi:D-proline reductase (dithiol) PrdA